MVRIRKRHADDNGIPQSKKTLMQNNIKSSCNLQNTSNLRQGSSNFSNCTSSTSHLVKHIRDFRSKNMISDTSSHKDSDSEGYEESFHRKKRGALRPLTDYETGESSDKSTVASLNSVNRWRNNCTPSNQSFLENSVPSVKAPGGKNNSRIHRQQKKALFSDSTSDSSDSGLPIGCRKSVKRMKLPSSSENSMSDEGTVKARNVKKLKRQANDSIASDSSNADVPVDFKRPVKRMRLPSSSNSNTSDDSSDANESSRPLSHVVSGIIRDLESRFRPRRYNFSSSLISRGPYQETGESSSGSGIVPRRQPTREKKRIQSKYESGSSDDFWDASESSLPNLMSNRISKFNSKLRPRRTVRSSSQISRVLQPNHATAESESGSATAESESGSSVVIRRQSLTRGRRILVTESEDDSSISDNEIRPRALSHHRPCVIQSDYSLSSSSSSTTTTTSSDTDDSIPFSITQRVPRRRSQRGILNSDDDEVSTEHVTGLEEVAVKISIQTDSYPKKSSHENSSDTSDGESEKCPICFSNFKLQQIGKPSSCDHKFCSLCIQQWAKNKVTCPIDRKTFNSITVYTHLDGKVLCELPVDKPVPNPPSPGDVSRWIPLPDFLMEGTNWGMIYPPVPSSDEDGPEEICCVCFSMERSEFMISCDFCNNVYHMDCVDPPLQYIPVEEWFCPPCVEAEMLNDETTSDSN